MSTRATDPADTTPVGVPLMDAVRPLQEQLQNVLATFDCVSNVDLKDMIVTVERLSWQVFAAQTLLAGEVDARVMSKPSKRSLTDDYGCASGHEFLQRCTRVSRREAASRMKLGRLLLPQMGPFEQRRAADLPVLSTALQAGTVSPQATKLIANALGKTWLMDTDKQAEAERCLVEAATGINLDTGVLEDLVEDEQERAREAQADHIRYINLLDDYAEQGALDPLPPLTSSALDSDATTDSSDPAGGADRGLVMSPALAKDADSLRLMVDEWKQVLAHEGTLLDEKLALPQRSFNFGPAKDGLVPVNGRLVPEVAATLSSLVDAINSPRNQNNKDGNDSAGEYRSPAQKRHDALASIVNMAASASEMPTHGGMPVTVLIETSREELEADGASWMYGPGSNKTLLTPEATWHGACSGAVQYYAKNAAGRLVALGSKQRVFTANQRKAIIARDGGCVIPGCATPPAWLEVHHVHGHSEGGPTHTDNGVALCWYHHRSLDTNGWEIRMDKGTPEIKAPTWIDPTQKWRKHKAPTLKPPKQRRFYRSKTTAPPKPRPPRRRDRASSAGQIARVRNIGL